MAEETRQVISQLGYEGEIYDIYDESAHERLDNLVIPEAGSKVTTVTSLPSNIQNDTVYIVYEIEHPYLFTLIYNGVEHKFYSSTNTIYVYYILTPTADSDPVNYYSDILRDTKTIENTDGYIQRCDTDYNGRPIKDSSPINLSNIMNDGSNEHYI